MLASEVINSFSSLLNRFNAKKEIREIVAYVLRKKAQCWLEWETVKVSMKELRIIEKLVKRLLKEEPLDYLVKRKTFYDLELFLNQNVLIPRHETEILVDHIIQQLEKVNLENKVLWDIGTGSGAIALSLKKRFPELHIVASDISVYALEIAKRNAKKNDLEIEFLRGDFLVPFKGKMADFVVSNPPYVSEEEYSDLEKSIFFEPKQALVAQESGLEFYRKFSKNLLQHLNPFAKIFFEIGKNQGKELKKIFENPLWAQKKLLKDWSGHDRFFFLEIE